MRRVRRERGVEHSRRRSNTDITEQGQGREQWQKQSEQHEEQTEEEATYTVPDNREP